MLLLDTRNNARYNNFDLNGIEVLATPTIDPIQINRFLPTSHF